MKDALKLIIVIAVVVLIAFPILAYLGYSPFAEWGNTIYTFFGGKITTTLSTVYGMVGATGVSAAAAIALGYLLKQKNKVIGWAQTTISGKDAAIEDLTGQTSTLTKASTLKDEAFTKLSIEKEAVTTELSGLKGQFSTMQGKLQTYETQTQNLVTKNASLIQDQVKQTLPSNEIFTSATDPNKTLLVVKEKYIT